jgi:ubiquitin-conjugating enzyme E2 D/E
MKINFDEQNMTEWEILMDGPEQSVYSVRRPFPPSHSLPQNTPLTPPQGGHFKLRLIFPTEYPFKPPVVSFKTKIYHPNISNDDKGSMCLGMLRPDAWKPPNKVISVLHLIRTLLIEPNVDDAIEASIAGEFKDNRKGFEKTAKEWVKQYAK